MGENENYLKVAKMFQKREQKKQDEKEIRGFSRPKPYSRAKQGYQPAASAGSASQVATSGSFRSQSSFSGGYSNRLGPSGFQPARRFPDRSKIRCHNCGDFGHYANECPKMNSNRM